MPVSAVFLPLLCCGLAGIHMRHASLYSVSGLIRSHHAFQCNISSFCKCSFHTASLQMLLSYSIICDQHEASCMWLEGQLNKNKPAMSLLSLPAIGLPSQLYCMSMQRQCISGWSWGAGLLIMRQRFPSRSPPLQTWEPSCAINHSS